MRQRSLARSTSCVKLTFSGSVESQYLVGSASPSGHSINSHSGDSFSGISLLYPTRTRTRAKREDSQSAEPSRHVTPRQACFGRPRATFLAEASSGSSRRDRKSTCLNSRHVAISYAVFCLKKKKKNECAQTYKKKKQNTIQLKQPNTKK